MDSNHQLEHLFDQSKFKEIEEKLCHIADKLNNRKPFNADDRLLIADLQHKYHQHSHGQIDIAYGIAAIIEKLRKNQTFNADDDNLLAEIAWIAQHQAHQQSQYFYKKNQENYAKHKAQGYTTEHDDDFNPRKS